METFLYTFSINVDDPMLKTCNPIFSSVFQTKFNDVTFSWKLKFSGKTAENNDRPALFLCADNGDKCVDAKFLFVLISNEKKDIFTIISEMRNFSNESGRNWGWKEFSRFSFKDQIPQEVKIHDDNCFKILCKIYIPHKCFAQYLPKPANEEISGEVTECLFSSCENFVLPKMLSDNFFNEAIGAQRPSADSLSDVILHSSDGKSFYCHKMILACSSETLKNIFSKLTRPKAKHVIRFDDIDSATLTEILRFIYKKEFSANLENLLENCLRSADKYGLADLKSKCIASLKFNLTQDNVLHYLKLADKYSSDSLKLGCFEILRLFDHMIDEAKLKTFFERHNSVYLAMIKYLYKRCNNGNLVV